MAGMDDRHLPGLLGSAGKHLANLPHAQQVVARLRRADSRDAFLGLVRGVDLGLDAKAHGVIEAAAENEERWREIHAALLRSAEQQLVERYHSNA